VLSVLFQNRDRADTGSFEESRVSVNKQGEATPRERSSTDGLGEKPRTNEICCC